jgi:hypothetical protein
MPIVLIERRAKPRTRAMATAIPAAAERNDWTVMPAICVR